MVSKEEKERKKERKAGVSKATGGCWDKNEIWGGVECRERKEGTEGKDQRVEGWQSEGTWQNGGKRTGRAEDTAVPKPLMCHISHSVCTHSYMAPEYGNATASSVTVSQRKNYNYKNEKLNLSILKEKQPTGLSASSTCSFPQAPGRRLRYGSSR